MTLAVSRLLVRTRARTGAPPAYARAAVAVVAGGGTTTTTGGRGHCRRLFSAEAVARPMQVYVSRSHDPFLNLSLEHYLLQKSAPESVVLFLYTNRPCVVVGRNQNPWLEVNLALLDRPGLLAPPSDDDAAAADDNDINSGVVQLVRRRSGGGTVFHDYGNVNYSVLCPPAAFDRNKHAEMVVRALRGLGVTTARVNERHDIVVSGNDDDDAGGTSSSSFKVSGSAYKLTRLRSLHHGTCLLSTPNLARIGHFLRSPAAPYLKARGVESVRSPIRNVGLPRAAFEDAVVAEFAALYGRVAVDAIGGPGGGDGDGGGDLLERLPDEVAKGYAELKVRMKFPPPPFPPQIDAAPFPARLERGSPSSDAYMLT